jgi:hypothetical protein
MACGQSLDLYLRPARIESRYADWWTGKRGLSQNGHRKDSLLRRAAHPGLFENRAVQGPHHFPAEFLVLRLFQMPVPPILTVRTESSSVLDITSGNSCENAHPQWLADSTESATDVRSSSVHARAGRRVRGTNVSTVQMLRISFLAMGVAIDQAPLGSPSCTSCLMCRISGSRATKRSNILGSKCVPLLEVIMANASGSGNAGL